MLLHKPGCSQILENRQTGGETVDKVLAADGSVFAGRKEARQRNGARYLLHRRGIMVRLAEEPGSAAVAGEKQGAGATCESSSPG